LKKVGVLNKFAQERERKSLARIIASYCEYAKLKLVVGSQMAIDEYNKCLKDINTI